MLKCFWWYRLLFHYLALFIHQNIKVSITQKTIIIKTLFKKIELNISDIEKYIYERYNKKIILYVFKLIVTNKKKILITRYKDEFIEILTQNNIDRVFD